ncbi:EF-hand domain-containing protein 1 [Caerostris darwini]|uniref:EF-hand domain-containing protein 1 n=1 Tax=Caerostris darwini TaxID=1538125 RepID=A0AAV4TTH6_9ARAC|nr:EF-hand domain-containing protein 1 [Caerostris darwini]
MSQSLPLLPGYKFPDYTKTHFGLPRTLVFSKGVPLTQPVASATSKRAIELLDSQNKVLDTDKVAELTYGPKRSPPREVQLPKSLALDKKVLRFHGYYREEIYDWSLENYRIRPVKVLYYLQDDTMEVVEPKIPNSGLVQGTLFKRHAFPHPSGKGRKYMWKDLNLRTDMLVYGLLIRLSDCDNWTRLKILSFEEPINYRGVFLQEYLIDAGIDLNEHEPIPPDPHEQQREEMGVRREARPRNMEEEKLFKFLTNDRKVLRFYGMWQDILADPPEMRRVVVQYYLADDTMEVLEDHARNSGRIPYKVLVKKQKIPVDMNELPVSFPRSYLEVKDDDMTWFSPQNLMTGKDIVVLGKKIFLYDSDEFTRHYYKTCFGEDLESIAVAEKPKPASAKIFPPHTGLGSWDDSMQNCLSLLPKAPKKNILKEMHFYGITLRYKAELMTPFKDDKMRRFVVSFHPGDDTVIITEDNVPNSGFDGGAFLKRGKLLKPESEKSLRPEYYTAPDFHIGAEIRASGKLFVLTDADRFVLTFMEEHPEIYSDKLIEIHRKSTTENILKSDAQMKERDGIMQMMREDVTKKFGQSPYPLPHFLEPPFDMQMKQKVEEEIYCANMPISPELLKKAVDICTDCNNRTDMNELRKLLLPPLGHDINKK